MPKIEGQPCPDCDKGTIVKNPRKGTLFCDKRCWLNKSSTGNYQTQISPNQEEKIREGFERRDKKIQELDNKIHALWATLIQGDEQKEKNYELHQTPTKVKAPEPEEEEVKIADVPF